MVFGGLGDVSSAQSLNPVTISLRLIQEETFLSCAEEERFDCWVNVMLECKTRMIVCLGSLEKARWFSIYFPERSVAPPLNFYYDFSVIKGQAQPHRTCEDNVWIKKHAFDISSCNNKKKRKTQTGILSYILGRVSSHPCSPSHYFVDASVGLEGDRHSSSDTKLHLGTLRFKTASWGSRIK